MRLPLPLRARRGLTPGLVILALCPAVVATVSALAHPAPSVSSPVAVDLGTTGRHLALPQREVTEPEVDATLPTATPTPTPTPVPTPTATPVPTQPPRAAQVVAPRPVAHPSTPAPAAVSYPPGAVPAIIVAAAQAHGISPAWMLKIAVCESGYNPRAYNASGPYYGLFQFLMSTFRANGGTNIWDPVQQANITATMLAHGQAHQWGCA